MDWLGKSLPSTVQYLWKRLVGDNDGEVEDLSVSKAAFGSLCFVVTGDYLSLEFF